MKKASRPPVRRETKSARELLELAEHADKDVAIKLLQRAVNLDNIEAMIKLGNCYMNAKTTAPDKLQQTLLSVKAVRLFQRATDLGSSEAMIRLGICYLHGSGLTKNASRAVELFQRASDLGNEYAKEKLDSVKKLEAKTKTSEHKLPEVVTIGSRAINTTLAQLDLSSGKNNGK